MLSFVFIVIVKRAKIFLKILNKHTFYYCENKTETKYKQSFFYVMMENRSLDTNCENKFRECYASNAYKTQVEEFRFYKLIILICHEFPIHVFACFQFEIDAFIYDFCSFVICEFTQRHKIDYNMISKLIDENVLSAS